MIGPDERTARGPLAASLAVLAGLLGAGGVAISAAATHRGGGSLATTAGLFCLMHAAAGLGLAALAQQAGRGATLFGIGGLVLVTGTAVFAGDLALAGLFAWHPLPLAAPLGGGAMLVGWLLVAAAGAFSVVRG